MLSSYLILIRIAIFSSCVLPLFIIVTNKTINSSRLNPGLLVFAGGTFIVLAVLWLLLNRLSKAIEEISQQQALFLDQLQDELVGAAIVISACLSLFFELSLIRWHSTVFPIFSEYKNYSLLACFAGLGLGYALAKRKEIPLVCTIPILVFEIGLMFFLRYWKSEISSALLFSPVVEQISLSMSGAKKVSQYINIYFFLGITFLLTALALIPIGQLCGRLMERRPKLSAYGKNLLGSLLGVILIFVLSFLWTPPVIWFSIGLFGVLLFLSFRNRVLITSCGFAFLCIIILTFPVNLLWEQMYSPYQLIERGGISTFKNWPTPMLVQAAGTYHQRVNDLSFDNANRYKNKLLQKIALYYEYPYRLFGKVKRVAVVGAGIGNDVAAALRMGAEQVDAIEIDPVILKLGLKYHPEQPYLDKRVNIIINDARSFFRTTKEKYDLIVYGLLDSHTLLSHASNVRIDSFVYTVEGLKEARECLNDNGVMSLSFCVVTKELGRKIYLMMREAFDGYPPVCFRGGYDKSVIFVQRKNKKIGIPENLTKEFGVKDYTQLYADPAIHADISTDNWPFFYMPKRVYPLSYVFMLLFVLLLSVFIIGSFFGAKPKFSHVAFFFLGAGFMLVETKGITEIGLTFGNTWHVIGIMIASILVMAFFANCIVQWFNIKNYFIPYILLFLSLSFGLFVSKTGGFPPTFMGRIATTAVLSCPLFFSGIVFSTLLRSSGDIAGVMAINLLGAMLGGILEYNSMYFGFQFLYWLGIGLYLIAFISSYSFPQYQGSRTS